MHQPGQLCSGADLIPLLSQVKCAWLWLCGDQASSRATWEKYVTYSIGASQLASCVDCLSGERGTAYQRQLEFFRGSWVWLQNLPMAALRSLLIMSGSAAAGFLAPGLDLVGPAGAALASATAGVAVGRLWSWGRTGDWGVHGQSHFDAAASVVVDGLRGWLGFELLAPDHLLAVSAYKEPLDVGDVGHLVLGSESPLLHGVPAEISDGAGVYHTYAVVQTQKGHEILSERMHDGTIHIEDLTVGKDLSVRHGHAVHHAPEAAEHLGATLINHKDAEAFLFVSDFKNFAVEESMSDYSLLGANCQHYVNDLLNLVGGRHNSISEMPNGTILPLARFIVPPFQAAVPEAATLTGAVVQTLKDSIVNDPQLLVVSVAVASEPTV